MRHDVKITKIVQSYLVAANEAKIEVGESKEGRRMESQTKLHGTPLAILKLLRSPLKSS